MKRRMLGGARCKLGCDRGRYGKEHSGDFPGGPVVKNPPSNEGDVGSIPGWGTKIPHTAEQLSLCALEPVPQRRSCVLQLRPDAAK